MFLIKRIGKQKNTPLYTVQGKGFLIIQRQKREDMSCMLFRFFTSMHNKTHCSWWDLILYFQIQGFGPKQSSNFLKVHYHLPGSVLLHKMVLHLSSYNWFVPFAFVHSTILCYTFWDFLASKFLILFFFSDQVHIHCPW